MRSKNTDSDSRHDWTRFDAMNEAERHAAAVRDPDAQPLTPERMARMHRTPQAQIICRALGLSRGEFAARFHIPPEIIRH
jgi:putative transcriptional regulator